MEGIYLEKKIYIMEHLGCANCAAKMEEKFNAHPQVQEAVIVFSTKQLRLTSEDPDALIPELQELARTVESGIVITPREACKDQSGEDRREGCSCGHDHHNPCSCGCGHPHSHEQEHPKAEKEAMPEETVLSLGAVLFAAGLILNYFGMAGLSFLCCLLSYVLLGRDVV